MSVTLGLKQLVETQMSYLEHLNHQYADRRIYWGLRDRAIHNRDLVFRAIVTYRVFCFHPLFFAALVCFDVSLPGVPP